MELKFDFRDYISYEEGKSYHANLSEEQLRQSDIMRCFSEEDRFVLWLTLVPNALSFLQIMAYWEDSPELLNKHLSYLFEKGLIHVQIEKGIPYYGVIIELIDPWIMDLLSGLVPYEITAKTYWYQLTDCDRREVQYN